MTGRANPAPHETAEAGELARRSVLELFTPQALADVRANARFLEAVRFVVPRSIDHYLGLEPGLRWMMKDIGRVSITVTAMILEAYNGEVTAQSLATASVADGHSSKGRVIQLLKRAEAEGQIRVPPGDRPWTQRPLSIAPPLAEAMRTRAIIEIDAAAILFPAIGDGAALVRDEARFRSFLSCVAIITTLRKDRLLRRPGNPLALFLHRELGVTLLYALMEAQPRQRARLLEAAPISRNALSQRFDISRAHIKRLLADAEAEGSVRCPSQDKIEFSPVLSDALEHQLAINFQIARAAAATPFEG